MSKYIAIGLGALFALLGVALLVYNRRSQSVDNGDGTWCMKPPRPGKFPKWQEGNVPGGDLNAIAREYFPDLDPGPTGSVVGGFFKALGIYPSNGAAKFYAKDLKKWGRSNMGLPYWQVVEGELLCE